ncbi:MAG: protoporphyrinogen/coproporphyrinogen oxidase [Longimicrobiales bacterium]
MAFLEQLEDEATPADPAAAPLISERTVHEQVKIEPRSVAVIGAGGAGLAAAWKLVRAGQEVTLFERRESAGGRMRTDQLDGIGYDAGAQLVSGSYTAFFSLTRSLNMADRLARSPGRDAVWRKGRAHILSYGSVASMIRSSALPTGLKLRLGAKYLPFLARQPRLDLHDLVHTGGVALDNESIGSWGMRELGADFVELLAYPLLGAYYGSAPEQTSAAVYHALARAGMDVSLYAARSGMGAIARDLAEGLASRGAGLRYNTGIERIEAVHNGVVLHRSAGAERYDAVVVAVPGGEAARLLDGHAISEWLGQVRSAATCTLALALARPSAADFFGLSLPRSEPKSAVVAVCVQERKVADLVPKGRGALVVMPAPDESGALAQLGPSEVFDRLMPAVERVLPGTLSAVLRARVTYFPEGNPVFYPGYVRRLEAMNTNLLPHGVALAGDYLVAPTVEGAVRSGVAAAERLLASFNP